MNENLKTELDKIVNTLVDTGIVTKIILFGSCARGEETPDSDIDLCVLTPLEEERTLDITVDLHVKLFDVLKISLDLLTYNQDFFAARAKTPGSLQGNILKHGVVLYG
jgi:predicted nucleotidyltransferase